MQLSGTSASPGKSFQKDKGYCEEETTVCISQRKKKIYFLLKNGLIEFKELVLKWRIKFALTQNCVNALCCLFCLIPSLDSLRIFVLLVRCARRCDTRWRGASAATYAVQNPWHRENRVSPAHHCAPLA